MKIERINPVENKEWDEFVEQHPLSSFYHQSAWARVIEESFSHARSCYFVLRNYADEIDAGLPLFLVRSKILGDRLISIPFTPHCDPLVRSELQWEILLDAVIEYQDMMGAEFLELRTFACSNHIFNGRLKDDGKYQTYELMLNKAPEILWKNFHKNCVQRAVKKAEKNDLQIHWGKDERDLLTFFQLLVKTRRKHGFPPQPYRFFKNMWDEFFPSGKIALPLALHNGRVVGGILLFKYRNRIHYEFVASDKNALAVRPNHFLVWESIKHAIEKGFQIFDFGKTPVENPGLIQFKERWGSIAKPLAYRYYSKKAGRLSEQGRAYRWMKNYFRFAPMMLSKLGGELVYHHIG